MAVALVALGVILLHVAHSTIAAHEWFHHLVRDVGIALIVSGTVSLLYESYFRSIIDVKKIGSVVNAVYSSYVPENVWGNIRDTLTKRDVIRNDTQIRLKVRRAATDGWLTLEIEQTYKLVGLYHKEREVTVLHEVDEDISPAGEKPRFERVDVDGESYAIPAATTRSAHPLAEGRITLDGPMLHLTVKVHPHDSAPVSVGVVRREYRRVPGLYYLVQPELTDGIKVYLDEYPDGIFVDLTVRPPQQRHFVMSADVPMVMINEIFLPGQCLEFKFHSRPPTATSS